VNDGEHLFVQDYHLVWTRALAAPALVPVRRLIWGAGRARAQQEQGELPGEDVRQSMWRRAGITAGLLVFVFSYFYTFAMLKP
jgi:hypothetical protein